MKRSGAAGSAAGLITAGGVNGLAHERNMQGLTSRQCSSVGWPPHHLATHACAMGAGIRLVEAQRTSLDCCCSLTGKMQKNASSRLAMHGVVHCVFFDNAAGCYVRLAAEVQGLACISRCLALQCSCSCCGCLLWLCIDLRASRPRLQLPAVAFVAAGQSAVLMWLACAAATCGCTGSKPGNRPAWSPMGKENLCNVQSCDPDTRQAQHGLFQSMHGHQPVHRLNVTFGICCDRS